MPAAAARRTPAQRRSEGANRSRARRAESPATVPRVSRIIPPDSSGQHFQGQRRTQRSGGSGGNSGGGSSSSMVQDTGQAYRQTKRSLGEVSGATPKLAAEWLVCVLIIVASTLTRDNDYSLNMSEALWRITATTGVFFVLAVASMSKSLSGLTVAFGALIMIAILFKSANEMKTVLDVASGKGSGQTSDQLDADTDPGGSTKVGHEFVK